MKVYTKVVMDLTTLEVIEEEFFEYSGPVIEAKGGGGGSAGKVGYPDYVETAHSKWLDDTASDAVNQSLVDIMNAAWATDPYTTMSPYNPDTVLAVMLEGVADFESQVDALSSGTTLTSLMNTVLDDSAIDDAVDAYSTELEADEDATTIPRFEAGMRDINAVYSSAFIIGRSVIEEGRARNVANYSAKLKLQKASDTAIRVIDMKLKYQMALAQTIVETNRMKIVAKKEQTDADNNYDVSSAKWDLEILLSGGSMLGMPSGGSYVPDNTGPSKLQSALGGAMSGAAMGAMAGSVVPGIGTAAGMAGGAVLGLASSFL